MTADATTARTSDHPVNPMFLNRYSPRAFTDATMTQAELLVLLEAARWAPSSSNLQPARLIWGLRGDAGFAAIAGALVPGNQIWAQKAAALVVMASKTMVEKEGVKSPIGTHAFDAGASWMSLALQAHLNGWIAHAMAGFDKAKAAEVLHMPADHDLHAVVALGRLGPPELLPEHLRPREVPSNRLALAQIATHGSF